MFCFHKWSKWEEYNRTIHVQLQYDYMTYRVGHDPKNDFVATKQIWQKRTCEKCGKSQRERVCD